MLPCLCVQNLLSIGFRTEMQLMTGVRRKQVSFTSQKCGHGKKYVVASLVSCFKYCKRHTCFQRFTVHKGQK